jgi:hypothetical protein
MFSDYHRSRIGQRLFLFRDVRALRSHLGIERGERLPIGGDIVLVEDGFDRALGHAGFAVDAFVGVNVKDLFALVKTFHRANHHAIGVLTGETRFTYYVRHRKNSPVFSLKWFASLAGDAAVIGKEDGLVQVRQPPFTE